MRQAIEHACRRRRRTLALTETADRPETPAGVALPRPITADYLRRAALRYLERYAASVAQLRRVLARKVAASCRHYGDEAARYAALVDETVERCVSAGLVDDRRFAESRAATLRRKGQSSRAVAAKLAAKGVARELVAEASHAGVEEELAAARIAARRKRLGPWRQNNRALMRQKDLTALIRAGFSATIARAVIDGGGDEL